MTINKSLSFGGMQVHTPVRTVFEQPDNKTAEVQTRLLAISRRLDGMSRSMSETDRFVGVPQKKVEKIKASERKALMGMAGELVSISRTVDASERPSNRVLFTHFQRLKEVIRTHHPEIPHLPHLNGNSSIAAALAGARRA